MACLFFLSARLFEAFEHGHARTQFSIRRETVERRCINNFGWFVYVSLSGTKRLSIETNTEEDHLDADIRGVASKPFFVTRDTNPYAR